MNQFRTFWLKRYLRQLEVVILMSIKIEDAKKQFFQMIDDFGTDPYRLRPHVPEVEKWAKYLIKRHPEADSEVVLLGVWYHDIGHYPLPTEIDHAVRGEDRARDILTASGYSGDRMNKVLHCVRAHRCRDVQPVTLEAKIVACADSASHVTELTYFDMARVDKETGEPFRAYAKLERDFRDLGIFPEVQEELKELCDNWKKVIQSYEKIDSH